MIDYDNITSADFRKIITWKAGDAALIIKDLYDTDWFSAFYRLYTSNTYHQLTNINTEFWKISPYWLHAEIMKEAGIKPLPGKEYYESSKFFKTVTKFSAFIEEQRISRHRMPSELLFELLNDKVLDCIFYESKNPRGLNNINYKKYLATEHQLPGYTD